ncbi:sporulation protein YqfD [Orenia marismortui]|uniref:sporulation protein YqfD n=1 Tax=Orenia marismortui TaxID=46469 RepID=UPI00036F876E|nr:sporulation protein YqfD [Orenia marismortui]
MLKKLYTLVEGYLQLEVKGRHFEKVVNILIRNGFKLWNIIRIDDTLYVNIRLKDFKNIRKHLRKVECKVRIKERKGLPFYLNKLIDRRFLAIGIIILILSLYTLSSFVFFIEIKGAKEVEKEDIKKLLTKASIKPGVLKSSIPVDKLEEVLIEKIPKISWVNIYFSGTRLVIDIVEKKIIESEMEPSDIIADKSGVISKLIVLQGTPVVEEGMTVKAGDLLISRELLIRREEEVASTDSGNEEEINILLEKKEVKAEGIVKARVWYEGYGEAKLFREYSQPTGNVEISIAIKLKDREIMIRGPKKSPYKYFKLSKEVKSLPKWRKFRLPIELVRRRYIQIKRIQERRSIDISKKLAKEEAVESILQGLSKEAIILNSKLKLIELDTEDNNIIRVKALLEVEEEIGIRRE